MRRKRDCAVLAALCVLLVLPACALRKGAPDPAKVQRKMDATLEGEKELIRSTVEDGERAERLVALLDKRDRLVSEHADTIADYRARMQALNADYDAPRESFDQAAADYNDQRAAWQRQFVELIDAMKKETTAKEWKAIAKYQLKNLNPRELAYKQPGGGA